MVEGVRFVRPREAGVQRQAWANTPGFAGIETVLVKDAVRAKVAPRNHPGADGRLKASQGKFEYVVQRGKRGRERNRRFEYPYLPRRPESELGCHAFVSVSVGDVLPIEAEAEAMIAFLPHEALGQLVAKSTEQSRAPISEHETSVGNRDPRCPQAETAGTVFGSRAPHRSVEE